MTFKNLLHSVGAITLPAMAWLVAGLPVFHLVVHGLDVSIWPTDAVMPMSWLWRLSMLDVLFIWNVYGEVLTGQSPALPQGGYIHGLVWTGSYVATVICLLPLGAPRDRYRDRSGQLGAARWANSSEKATMRRGLEFGLDPETKKPIRIAVESNLLSIAPPRTGKTSGLIIPNLLVADNDAWNGPLVIIDPKGEVFAATAKRRSELGRRVIRFDLRRGARNSHRWNPLAGIAIDDTERLMAMARTGVTDGGTENAYFTDRAVDVLAGTMAAEMRDAARAKRQPTLTEVARLLSAPDELFEIARTGESPILRSLAGDLQLDQRSRDQLLSTSKTAVSWLSEERYGQLTAQSTFSMSDVARGHADLFIIVSPESIRLVAPLLRWMLADLIVRARTDRQHGDERLLVLIDEAAALGRFPELEQAVGLLPGLGISFWTFWQSKAQIEDRYGAGGFKVFIDTAEIVTVSDFSRLGDDAEAISSALGNYTALVESSSTQKTSTGQSSGTSRVKQAVRLTTAEDLRAMSASELIVLVNSKRYGKYPLRLRKTRYFDDPRFAGLYRDVTPTQAL